MRKEREHREVEGKNGKKRSIRKIKGEKKGEGVDEKRTGKRNNISYDVSYENNCVFYSSSVVVRRSKSV